ncbi:MAG: hypothetical protein JXB23_16245 [Candidatus Aminicenantes bacterium]|nr:hypothetical protein [Candidatus Aminicenantes bacterium]
MKKRTKGFVFILSFIIFSVLITGGTSCSRGTSPNLRFEISLEPSLQAEAVTGRMFVLLEKSDKEKPSSLNIRSWRSSPFFGIDVENFEAGSVAVIDENVLGYPLKSLRDIPSGDYYIQALLNVYTEFHRSDGHTIWAHLDRWEENSRSTGNLRSEIQTVHLDPSKGYKIKLALNTPEPPGEAEKDTPWIKRVRIQSKLLTEFWGQPMYVGARVLLPKGYDSHMDVRYPVQYLNGWVFTDPHNFNEEGDFYKVWTSDDFPRIIAVTIQHPCPFFIDSYATNSANNGPYGDAIVTELIPYLEDHFRMIREPYARVLTGRSTGGWTALSLQAFYPDFFSGLWCFDPDPVDFRSYILTNIYEDKNAFTIGRGWLTFERPMMRDVSGQVMVTMRQLSQLEAALGSKGRSGSQYDAWQSVFGPVGDDGYPKPLWDKLTGEIDPEVAQYFKEHYDLREYLEKNWPRIGPKLTGKLHFFCGDMDNFYLNEAVYDLEKFLENTKHPYYQGWFRYGRPRKGHDWRPFGRFDGELERMMAEHVRKNTPRGKNASSWLYQ